MSIDSALNLGLPASPLTPDPKIAGELQLVYNALHAIQQALNDAGIPSGGTTPAPGTLAVTSGGTGRNTGATAYGLLAAGTTATGNHQTVAPGNSGDVLVSGGAAALPAFTAPTGTGSPAKANTPTFITPKLTGYTVATLPAGAVGMLAYVTDALAPAFHAVVAGGGAVVTPVFYDGANWIVI